MAITFKIETITPAIAYKMLEGNMHNRKLKQHKIEKWAFSMKRGEWRENGESIKLNGTSLLDGQHRLWGCIEADCSFKTLVIRGLSKDVQKTLDLGAIRTGNDHFEMEGENYPGLLSGTVAKVMAHAEGVPRIRTGVSNIQLEEYLTAHPDIREMVTHYGQITLKSLTAVIATAAHYIFAQLDTDEADEFMAMVIEGIALKKETPTICLRDKLIKDMTARRRIPTDVKYALLIKTWNLHRRGVNCKRVGFRTGDKPEPFPRAF